MIMNMKSDMPEKFVDEEFIKAYPFAKRFVKESRFYKIFKIVIGNALNMWCMQNSNDEEGIPPIYTLMRVSNFKNYAHITAYEKRSLGAAVGYMFRHILGYEHAIRVRIDDVLYPILKCGNIYLKKKPTIQF